ncbi:lysozyme, partial [Pseudomonas juntendi]
SFTYNLGAANLESSTLRRLLNSGDYAGAADQFPRWNKAGGKVLAGLTRRRAAERDLFLEPA